MHFANFVNYQQRFFWLLPKRNLHVITICKRCGTDTRRKERISNILNSILFGKYEILSVLGKGACSTVYLAKHLYLKSYRAIKCIPLNFAPISSQCQEAELLRHLNHPGIPTLYDIEQDQNYLYIVEEYIPGESLDTFVNHQHYISQELIIYFGIELCEIFIYLHQFSPLPIIYQDLKPEHIILCENHLKLIDFGIANFYTDSDKHFQFYGTKEFAAPEVLLGLTVTPLSDLYSIGKILLFLLDHSNATCSDSLKNVIEKACATEAKERYETVNDFKLALEHIQNHVHSSVSHLYRKIIVLGSKPGVGTTHIAMALVNTLNQNGYPAIYLEQNSSDSLRSFMRFDHQVKEKEGICHYKFFQGIPNYGSGIDILPPSHTLIVEDYGSRTDDFCQYEPDTLILFVMGSDVWDMEHAISAGLRLKHGQTLIFLCNHGNKNAAKRYARHLGENVYCYPADTNPFSNTTEKERLFFHILKLRRRRKKWFLFNPFLQKDKDFDYP